MPDGPNTLENQVNCPMEDINKCENPIEIFSDVNKISVFAKQMIVFLDTGVTATWKGRKEKLGNITT